MTDFGMTVRIERRGAGRRIQSTLRQTSPLPAQCKRRAGSRMAPGELEAGGAPEEIPRDTPRKRARFGLGVVVGTSHRVQM